MIQGLQVPPREYFLGGAPFPIGHVAAATAKRHIILLCVAEDIPQWSNRVSLHGHRRDEQGDPIARLEHRYLARDLAARRTLYREACRVLRAAGAWIRIRKPIYTFSHAVGSCRFGDDPAHAPLDPYCRLHGVDNLFVVDGSFMPTAGGVNPSLTIAANALRVGQYVSDHWSQITP